MGDLTIDGAALDHVAHAVHQWYDVWDRYAVELGADWASGGPGPGFAPAQLRFANDARIELLRPCNVEVNDFLARFLERSGPGPHHLTFKVPSLDGALDRVERAGFEPINIDRSDTEWLEAFIHPKQASGVVVQLAEAGTPWSNPAPEDFPTGRRTVRDGTRPIAPSSLRLVVHAVADLPTARLLFIDLLGGEVVSSGARDGLEWVDLFWSGPLGIRIVSPTSSAGDHPLVAWLGGRSGRIHHLLLDAEEPEDVDGARTLPPSAVPGPHPEDVGPLVEVPPERNGGLRLVLAPR